MTPVTWGWKTFKGFLDPALPVTAVLPPNRLIEGNDSFVQSQEDYFSNRTGTPWSGYHDGHVPRCCQWKAIQKDDLHYFGHEEASRPVDSCLGSEYGRGATMNFLIPTEIETQRLRLRMFKEDDWDPLFEMFQDEECVRYTVKTPLTKWQTWRTLASYLGHWHLRGYGPYAVVEKATGHMAGPVGLWYPGDWPEPEIKRSLARRFWGRGYASEAAVEVQKVAFDALKTDRLISLILPENIRSKSLSTRIGGVFEKNMPFRDATADIYVYHQRKDQNEK